MSQTGTKDSRTFSRWAGTFSPGWSYEPGLKVSLVPNAKNTGTKAKFRSGSNVVSLLVNGSLCTRFGTPKDIMIFFTDGTNKGNLKSILVTDRMCIHLPDNMAYRNGVIF